MMMYLGIISIILIGTLLHFLYEFSHHNKFVAVFAAVNESVWEHIKIAMTPTFLWTIVLGFHYGWDARILVGLALCLSVIIIMIPALFYAYTAFTKKSILLVDIICFSTTIFCSELVFFHFINYYAPLPLFCIIASIILLIIEILIYFSFTFFPPNNLFFKDPISKQYGLRGHTHHEHHHDKQHHKHEKSSHKAS